MRIFQKHSQILLTPNLLTVVYSFIFDLTSHCYSLAFSLFFHFSIMVCGVLTLIMSWASLGVGTATAVVSYCVFTWLLTWNPLWSCPGNKSVTSFTFFFPFLKTMWMFVSQERGGRELCETLRRLSGFSDCICASRGACQFAKLITKPWSFKLDSPLA